MLGRGIPWCCHFVISNKGIWLRLGELFKNCSSRKNKGIFRCCFVDFLIDHSATRIIDENSKRVLNSEPFWCLGRLSRWYPVNAETPTPRSWIRCTRLLRCRCRPPERSPKAGEGKVTHKVGPLGSFYMWGPYKRPHKWETYKNCLQTKKHIRYMYTFTCTCTSRCSVCIHI